MTDDERREAIALRRDLPRLECEGVAAARELRVLEQDLRRRASDAAHLAELLDVYAPVLSELRERMDASEAAEARIYELEKGKP